MSSPLTWSRLASNFVKKHELADTFGMGVSWSPIGAAITGRMMKLMAERLDELGPPPTLEDLKRVHGPVPPSGDGNDPGIDGSRGDSTVD